MGDSKVSGKATAKKLPFSTHIFIFVFIRENIPLTIFTQGKNNGLSTEKASLINFRSVPSSIRFGIRYKIQYGREKDPVRLGLVCYGLAVDNS